MSGWIKLHRSLLNKSFFKQPEKLALWILLLLKANHKEREETLGGKKIICQPGQLTTGRKQLANELGISEWKVNRFLTCFEIAQQIAQQKTNTNRLISIINWNKYQIDAQQIAQQVHNGCTTDAHTTRREEVTTSLNSAENFKISDYGQRPHFGIPGGDVFLDRFKRNAKETKQDGETGV